MKKKPQIYSAATYDINGKLIGMIPNIVKGDSETDWKKGKPLDYKKYEFSNPDCICLDDGIKIVVNGKCPIHKPIIR